MDKHAHRWKIASPTGPTSLGTCDCGAEREFSNIALEDLPGEWGKKRGEGKRKK